MRFADDVVALCGTYAEAQEIERAFSQHCQTSGLVINEKKSDGISIISANRAELKHHQGFNYLGYRFTKNGLTIPDKVKKRIRNKLSRLIQIYLIQCPLKYGFNGNRTGVSPNYDWDLLGLISEVRGYLYGGLSEAEIVSFLEQGRKLRTMRSLMGFHPLLEQKKELQELDGWLVNNIRRAMQKRSQILYSRYRVTGLQPTNEELILGSWLDLAAWEDEAPPEVRLPSFVRGWRAARKYYFTFGLEDVEPPTYGYY